MKRRSLFRRMLTSHLVVAVAGVLALGAVVDGVLERRVEHDLERRLVAEARTVEAAGAGISGSELQAAVRAMGSASGTRFTVVRTDGVVVADSEHDPRAMENHASRREIGDAIAGRIGAARRVSDTLGRPFLYVAIPARDGRVVRAAISAEVVQERRDEVRRLVAVALLLVLVLAAGLAAVAARSVSRPLSSLADGVARVRTREADTVPVSGPPEIRSVADAVNEMATEISARVDDLARESALREQILSSMTEGVVLAEPGGAIAYANPAAVSFIGETPALPHAVAAPGVHDLTVHHPSRRDLRAATVRLANGRTLVALLDVTESRRVDAMRRDFVADASHELKTPVAAVLATAETLRQALVDDPDSARRFTERLVAEATRLAALVTELLDLARFERATPPADAGSVELRELVVRETEMIRPLAERKGLTVEVALNGDPVVRARADDLALAVRNLLDNAVRYTDEGGIAVAVGTSNGSASVRISDTGVGIPAKDLPRIFERFYRVDKARSRDTGGTGLGLSIVRHIVEGAGGTVTVESTLGRGSRFTMTVPLVSRDAPPGTLGS